MWYTLTFIIGLFLGGIMGFLVTTVIASRVPEADYFNDIEYHMSDIYGKEPDNKEETEGDLHEQILPRHKSL